MAKSKAAAKSQNESTALTVIEKRGEISIHGGHRLDNDDINTAVALGRAFAEATGGIPQVFRKNVGACVLVCLRAKTWGLDPGAIIAESYLVNNAIAFSGKVFNALANTVALGAGLDEPLDFDFDGEGQNLKVIVTGKINGKERKYISPMLKDIKIQNSPLWKTEPSQQFIYYGGRAWMRAWMPHVLLGAYHIEELQQPGFVVNDADRVGAIEHKADPLHDDVDQNAPSPAAPLPHRMSYALEQAADEDAVKAVMLNFSAEIELVPDEKDREPLRNLAALHLQRVRGKIPADEAMQKSKATRDQ
jgi:hypothetical protein